MIARRRITIHLNSGATVECHCSSVDLVMDNDKLSRIEIKDGTIDLMYLDPSHVSAITRAVV